MAVGGRVTNSGYDYTTLAEEWTAGKWVVRPTPLANAGDHEFFAVSCTASNACTAVGYYDGVAGREPLVERWDGASFTAEPAPVAAGAIGILGGVSCTSSTQCVAVGAYATGPGHIFTLAERWDGSVWTVEPTPSPAGTHPSLLDDVSCTAENACLAVGEYKNGAGRFRAFAERWDGTNWAIVSTARPPGVTSSALASVSCVSQSACTAAGEYAASRHGVRTLAERWDGTVWTFQPTRTPRHSRMSFFNSVSCSSLATCTAVGYEKRHSLGATLAERWNDGTGSASARGPAYPRASSGSSVLVRRDEMLFSRALEMKPHRRSP
jgi:hypothetical protein